MSANRVWRSISPFQGLGAPVTYKSRHPGVKVPITFDPTAPTQGGLMQMSSSMEPAEFEAGIEGWLKELVANGETQFDLKNQYCNLNKDVVSEKVRAAFSKYASGSCGKNSDLPPLGMNPRLKLLLIIGGSAAGLALVGAAWWYLKKRKQR